MVYATWYMLHDTWYMLHGTCYMVHATCYIVLNSLLLRSHRSKFKYSIYLSIESIYMFRKICIKPMYYLLKFISIFFIFLFQNFIIQSFIHSFKALIFSLGDENAQFVEKISKIPKTVNF